MVTYRKKPLKFRDGGAVPIDDVIAADPAPAAPAPPPDEPIAPPVDNERDAVLRALERTRHAEELHRQAAARPPTLEQLVDSIPGISDHKKQLLKEHPQLIDPANGPAVRFYYQAALDAGVPDDTEAMNRAILAGLQREKQWAMENARRAASLHERSIDEEVARLDAEVELARTSIAAERSTPNAINAARQADRFIDDVRVSMGEQSFLPAAMPARRRSMPGGAPVSRDVPSPSGAHVSISNRTLSAAEVEIAHNSFTDTTMTNREKELLYLQNREKLRRMRETGEYRQTTEQSG